MLRLYSFWTEGGELEALTGLISAFEDRRPDVSVSVVRQEGGLQGFQNLFRFSSEEKTYPDLFQGNAGFGLLEWVLLDQIGPDNSIVLPLDAVFRGVAPEAFHSAALRSVTYRTYSRSADECLEAPPCLVDRYYGLPLNIHRNNGMFYDPRFFAARGLTPPRSLDELYALCATLRADGVTPVSMGTKGRWPLHVLLESVMLASAGADFYRRFWRGELAFAGATSTAATIDRVLDHMLAFRGCLNVDAAQIDWAPGVERVTKPKGPDGGSESAAMAVMGDWATGLLRSQGYVPEQDYALQPFPGTERMFVMTVDVFAVPLGAANRDVSLEFLETLADRDVQVGFSRIKGSIPARADIDVEQLDRMSQQSYCALRGGSLEGLRRPDAEPCPDAEPGVDVVFSIAMLLPNRVVEALDTALVDMFKDGEKETVRLMLRSYYPLFASAARLSGL